MKNQNPVDTGFGNAFPKLLSELDHGIAQDDASEKLTDLVRAVREHVKPGSLTLKLKIVPAGSGQLMTITYDVKVDMPKPDKEATLLFATENGRLQRDNPEQQTLNLRTVPADAEKTAKEVVNREPNALKSVAS
jgi:hypothetical protein